MDARRHRRADTVTSGPVLHMRESSLSAHACSGRAAQRGARPALRADQGIELGEYVLLPVRRQKRAGARGPIRHMRDSGPAALACSGRAAQRGRREARPAPRTDQGIELGEYALLPVRRQRPAGARGPDAGQRPRGARLQRPRGAARGAACPAHRPGQ